MSSPDKKLGKGWKSDKDRAVTTAADIDGLKLLVSDSAKAYAWKTAATLSEPGLPADSWIGNQCVIDHDHAAAVYAPRTFTNKPDLMQGGAFAAIVNLSTGAVTKLPFTASLAYFDPSCNPATHSAAFTAFRDMNNPGSTKTRVLSVNTVGKVLSSSTVKGEVTSAVPVKNGEVAALGRRLIHLNRTGKATTVATAGGLPFDIHPMNDGQISFVERHGAKTARARIADGHTLRTIASGKLGAFDLKRGGGSKVFLTGTTDAGAATSTPGITRLNAPADADISARGRLAVQAPLTPGMRAGLEHVANAGKGFSKAQRSAQDEASQAPTSAVTADQPIAVNSLATATGAHLSQAVADGTGSAGSQQLSPALAGSSKARASAKAATAADDGNAHDPVDEDRWCSVSRNDVHAQALQPTPNQVEWAVDMAVRGDLRAGYIRQGGYRSQAGLGDIDPQGLFPAPKLTGGGRIPANVMLGIMAQESNLWQAESGAIPGQMGNPLAAVDGYYGHQTDPGMPASYWNINWDKSDCGYGVGQVTDGMRVKGHEKPGETSLDAPLQKGIAVDYATNIAASMKILADKWNEVHKDGQKVTVNNDDSSRVENWFTAVWNYNLGFNPPSQAGSNGGHWGLGWYNNPANPIYKKSWNHPFMDTDVDGTEANHDAAHPQDWPYEEKVMGWAAWSIDTGYSYGTDGRQDWKGESGFSSAGFRPAWWTSTGQRSQVSPPLNTFCNSDNNCDPDTPPNCGTEECYTQYWWDKDKASWKTNCDNDCGHELIKYQTLIQEPGRGTRLKDGTPVCTGAPAGSQVIASVPDGTETWSDCGKTSSAGSFQFTFNPGTMALPTYEAKADLHQIGGGYGGHFWYAHTRDTDHLGGSDGLMTVKGDWKLGNSVKDGGAKIWAHVPDTGAQTGQAVYQIVTPFGTVDKTIDQKANAGKWVSLGAYNFKDQAPEVKLSNTTSDGSGDDDIAWGAIAVQPGDFSGLPQVHFPAADANAPDVDFIASQKPQNAGLPTAMRKAAIEPQCSDSGGTRLCATYRPLTLAERTKAQAAAQPRIRQSKAVGNLVPWCADAGDDYSFTRTDGCLRGAMHFEAEKGGVPVGQATFSVTQEIKLNEKAPQFKVYTELYPINITGVVSTSMATFTDDCWPTTACQSSSGPWTGATTWAAGDKHIASRTVTHTYDPAANSGAPTNIDLAWDTTWTTPEADTPASAKWDHSAFTVRCDNQVGNGKKPGCVFPNDVPVLTLNTHKYPAAAAYYWIVMEKLASHPGSQKYKKPLHRILDDNVAVSNRGKMCDLKVAEWNPNPNADGESCDEYPFAKARESGGMKLDSGKECVQMYAKDGTIKLDENYALPTWNEICGRAAVVTLQNTSAGGDLGRFTTDVRLVDNEAYYVETGYEGCNLDEVCNIK